MLCKSKKRMTHSLSQNMHCFLLGHFLFSSVVFHYCALDHYTHTLAAKRLPVLECLRAKVKFTLLYSCITEVTVAVCKRLLRWPYYKTHNNILFILCTPTKGGFFLNRFHTSRSITRLSSTSLFFTFLLSTTL